MCPVSAVQFKKRVMQSVLLELPVHPGHRLIHCQCDDGRWGGNRQDRVLGNGQGEFLLRRMRKMPCPWGEVTFESCLISRQEASVATWGGRGVTETKGQEVGRGSETKVSHFYFF